MAEKSGQKAAAAAKDGKATMVAAAMATPVSKRSDGSASRGNSKSPAESKTPDPAASLSARLGNMVLLDKEAEGIFFEAP